MNQKKPDISQDNHHLLSNNLQSPSSHHNHHNENPTSYSQTSLTSKTVCPDLSELSAMLHPEQEEEKVYGQEIVKDVQSPKTQSVSSVDEKNKQEGLSNEFKDLKILEDECIDLPLADILVLNSMKRGQTFCLSESDKSENANNFYEKINPLGESFYSEDAPQYQNKTKNCSHCSLLRKSNSKVKDQNHKLQSQLFYVNKQLAELKELKKLSQLQSSHHQLDAQTQSNSIINYLTLVHKEISRLKETEIEQNLSLSSTSDNLISQVILDLQYLKLFMRKDDVLEKQNVLGKDVLLQSSHKDDRKIVQTIIKKCDEREQKMFQDLKIFLNFLHSNNQPSPNYHEFKSKKTESLYISTQDLEYNITQLQLNETIRKLQSDLIDSKKTISSLESMLKSSEQKTSREIEELNSYKRQFMRQNLKRRMQFNEFIAKAAQKAKNEQKVHKIFFNRISQSVFQISNCIPFQENDEQNLFVADDEDQLDDMIERIRRFALKEEHYRDRREKQQIQMKKNITLLFKKLVLLGELPIQSAIDAIKMNEDWKLDYLRLYLLGLKEKHVNRVAKTEKIKTEKKSLNATSKRSLSLEKMECLTFVSKSKE